MSELENLSVSNSLRVSPSQWPILPTQEMVNGWQAVRSLTQWPIRMRGIKKWHSWRNWFQWRFQLQLPDLTRLLSSPCLLLSAKDELNLVPFPTSLGRFSFSFLPQVPLHLHPRTLQALSIVSAESKSRERQRDREEGGREVAGKLFWLFYPWRRRRRRRRRRRGRWSVWSASPWFQFWSRRSLLHWPIS